MRVLAIDPGNTESAYCIIDSASRRPIEFAKVPNETLLLRLQHYDVSTAIDHVHVIEMVASYGMAVGREVFETCVWIGRFAARIDQWSTAEFVYRKDVKLHHCHTVAAKDSNVRQALVDRFTPGQRNHGKGTKNEPGWFYGFRADIWQAYALAVYKADQIEGAPF